MEAVILPIIGLLIDITLVTLFYSKRHIINKETKIYSKLLFLCEAFILVGIVTFVVAKLTNNFSMIGIFQKVYMSILILLHYFSIKYCLVIFNLDIKKYNIINRVLILLTVISIILIIILPLNVIFYDNVLDGEGLSYNVAIAYSFCSFIIFLGLTFYLICKKISIEKLIPFLILILLYLVGFVLRTVYRELIFEGFFFSYILFIMYHTIENPDVKMVKQMEFAKTRAEKANNAKTDFLSSMSHEIRTPLNAIVGFSEELKNENDKDKRDKDIDDIILASQNLLEIVNGILDINKIESGNMEVVNEIYNPYELLDEIVKLITPRLNKKDLNFITKYNDLPYKLSGDKGKVREIILNLFTNAIKYTDEGIIEVNISCINKNSKDYLIVEVKDTGRGIKEENMSKLFTKFNRLDSDKNSTIEGTGLGLALTKNLVDMLGGKIKVESEYGKGSCFTAIIPQEIVTLQEQVNTKQETNDSHENVSIDDYSDKRVLLVDDNNLNIKVATRFLNKYNINPDSCISGKECIEKINSGNDYDLILMDDMMSEMSGTETCNKLKANGIKIPIIVLTANAVKGQREEYLTKGFDEYLSKPINQKELSRILKLFLN